MIICCIKTMLLGGIRAVVVRMACMCLAGWTECNVLLIKSNVTAEHVKIFLTMWNEGFMRLYMS